MLIAQAAEVVGTAQPVQRSFSLQRRMSKEAPRGTSSECDSCGRERWLVWHFILFEEPKPTGSRPSDLIGLYKQHMKHHPPNTHKGGQGESTEAIECVKIPRSDTNEVGEYGVTVTSEHTHKQKEERDRKEKRRLCKLDVGV